jgi:P-type Mg2+ transporter
MMCAGCHNPDMPSAKHNPAIRFSPLILETARLDAKDALAKFQTPAEGLSAETAAERLQAHGPNDMGREKERGWLWRLGVAARNPLVILLSVLAIIEFATKDYRSGVVMSLMVVLGVGLRFVQEARADAAAARLKAMIRVTATVVRGGKPREIPLRELVPGDLIQLSAGDMIPADVRLLTAKDLFIIQSSLTGESLPVEKTDAPDTTPNRPPLELVNIAYLGTSVESGAATAIVLATGPQTYFGSMAKAISGPQVETSFDKGINQFTWLMIRFMMVMVPVVFLINGLTKHNWNEAFFFSLAVAVGLTPEMLPMIVSVCLSKGAIAMSGKKVIVKRLNSIQNFGAMDVLCADKTGTLTMDRVILEYHCDVAREEDDRVLLMAYLISYFQTGLKNVLDRAILEHEDLQPQLAQEGTRKVDEIPFDFSRRIMSVVIETPQGSHRLLTKGAPEEIFKRCNRFELNGDVFEMNPVLLFDLKDEYEHLNANGFRVLAVAYKDLDHRSQCTRLDENDLILIGYVAFLDPPKETAEPALAALAKHGVTVKILTGDNDLVSRKVCVDVGLKVDRVILGSQVEVLTDDELAKTVEENTLFARLSPAHKQRIVKRLQANGHVVGFMGDGINDSPALRAADVGISVDSAVDIAKDSADVILLEKSLMVLEQGVIEGRKVFANILKYVRMGASSNFGNMFSVLGASAFLPFVPMAPMQILTNNLLYDFSQIAIPTDNVDEEQVAKPRPWSVGEIRRFILCIGPLSSIFDYTTYFIMLYVFDCWNPARAAVFQTGWFIESLMTQTLIIHIIRTHRIPFLQSRPSILLTVTTLAIMGIGVWLPRSPLGPALGFTALPPLYWPLLALTLGLYLALTQTVKTALLKKGWI